MRKLFLSILLITFIPMVPAQTAAAKQKQITITVKSSPDSEFQTTLKIRGNKMAQAILSGQRKPVAQPINLSDMYIKAGNQHLLLGRKGNVFDLEGKEQLILPLNVEKQLLDYAQWLRDKHYGEMISWEEVKKIIPTKAKFTVVDLETGKQFDVQRRAGNAHADVQPLTTEDTKTMKDIYNGHWSWRRRSILVKTDDHTIAASMHGMPHGAGALSNGFPGHFCIHFWKSKTHRSAKMDPDHKIMVYQAAGEIYNYLEEATPYEVVDSFFVAINQNNPQLLKMILARDNTKKTKKLLQTLENIEAINNASSLKEDDAVTPVGMKIPVDVGIYWRGRGETKDTLNFIVTRNAPGEQWRIDIDSLLKSLD